MVVTRGQGALAGPTLFGVSVVGFAHMAWVYDHSAHFSFPFGARVGSSVDIHYAVVVDFAEVPWTMLGDTALGMLLPHRDTESTGFELVLSDLFWK
jgi:hypothetical protein